MDAKTTFTPDKPPVSRSRFIAEDPRFLIATFALIVVSVFAIPSSAGLLLLILYILAAHRLAGGAPVAFLRTARYIVPFMLLITALNALFITGQPLPWPVAFLSVEGLASGFYYSLRVLALFLSMGMFLSVASQEKFAGGLAALVRPISPVLARRVALYGFLSMGFIPLFAGEIERIRMAQRFRGGGMEGGVLRRIAGARLLLVPLLLSAIHRSTQLAMAVEVRGIRSAVGGLIVINKPTRRDFLFLFVTVAVLAVISLIG